MTREPVSLPVATGLPSAVSPRWKPLRAGLVDLFYYDQQEFHFRDGRLLLRGNNGAGKSKVLALLLPFLFDGDLAPHRVEPDADPRKRMEWNLLLGGAHPHPERIGYSWMEFGRIDDDGTLRFCTIGCGMKAVSGRGIAAHWYFVSSARVGQQLRLLDDQGYPLGRDRLAEQLIGNGDRYDTATAYRRAVDEALFGFGELRYSALVDLLIRLRQPQLSKKPSERVLSQALTESLPPLDQAILADVAEAFRSLQDNRDELAEMTAALAGTTGFLSTYRDYARVACRRKTTRLRQAHSRYEQIGRELGEAKAALAAAEAAEARLRAHKQQVDDQIERLREHRQGLLDSEAADAARNLEEARGAADEAGRLHRDRAADHEEAERVCAGWQQRLLAADEAVAQAEAEFAGACRRGAHEAVRAALAAVHEAEIGSQLDRVRPRESTGHADVDVPVLRRAADRIVAAQSAAIKHVRRMITDADSAHRRLVVARNLVDKLDADIAMLAEQAEAAERRVHSEAAQLTADTSAYLRSTTELVLPDLAGVLDELAAWGPLLGGDSPAQSAVAARATVLGEELTRADAELQMAESAAERTRRERSAELERLRDGGIEFPPVPYTRDPGARAERDGAALWQVISFAGEVPEADRAGLEAALEAAGVLDAWVSPDGQLRTDGGEVIVSADAPAPGRTLARVLVPAIDTTDSRAAAVHPDTVAAVLGAIGFGADSAHHTWVDTTGRYRIGVLDGSWCKPAAQYIGAVAREQFRRQRIAAVESEIAEITERLGEFAAQRHALGERKRTLRAEAAGLPSDAALRNAHRQLGELDNRKRLLAEERAAAVAESARADAAATTATAELERDAADAGLPAEPAALDEITDALADYRVAVAALWTAIDKVYDSGKQYGQARRDTEDAKQRLAERAEAAEHARLNALRTQQRYDTLNANVGADVAQLRTDLAQVAADMRTQQALLEQLGSQLDQALLDKGEANGKQIELSSRLDQERATRDDAITGVRRFAETGLFEVAGAETELPGEDSWSAAAAVGFARAVDVELTDVAEDDKTLDRVQRRVAEEHKNLADLLSAQGNSASMTLREEAIVVEVVFRGRPVTVTELAATLAGEVSDRNRLLTEREREVLENHLVDEVASALQELILAAEAQVSRMNAELEARPTSTGMRLRLRWVPSDEAPTGAKAALRQLRRTADVWNEADRAAVGEFLQQEIERVRTADITGTWLEHLTAAFDYRRWNRFVIELQQRGQWRSATGPASGGERVLAASVPLFAAASAHYASAGNPHAPRLVMLDEAFAGVDDNARAKYLGLLAAFDLDVVMTSEREWGCYPEVPGLAIAQLARTDDVAAVLVTHWEWDGNQRRRVDYTAPAASLSLPAPVGADPDGLF